MDIVEYTDDEIRKNLALLETHLKQAPFSDKLFCEECINKHILILEGLAEEGITSCLDCDPEKYGILIKFLEQIKDQDYQKQGIELAKQTRRLRKNFIPCDEYGIRDRDDIKEKIKELEEERKLSTDSPSQNRLDYGICLLQWVNRGRKCSDG